MTPQALQYLASQPWALETKTLAVMKDIAAREWQITEAVAKQFGERSGPNSTKRDGVTLIGVNGVISRYASLFHAACGGASVETLAKEFNQALSDPDTNAIILNIDSPGGQVNGINELGEMIHAARGTKPIVAYVGGAGCSAAYWLATAADEIVLDNTASVGSIGVVATYVKQKHDDKDVFEMVSSQSPKKRLEPDSQDGKATYQAELDQLADIFIDRVARNLSVSRDDVLAKFCQGGTAIGQTAIDKGMAHRLGSLENLITELQKRKTTKNMSEHFSINVAGEANTTEIAATLKQQFPEAVSALIAESVDSEPSALSAAAEIAQACIEADVSSMAAKLLNSSTTKAEAFQQIEDAKAIKNACAAAGIEASFDKIMADRNDLGKLIGTAIHEAQASSEQDTTSHITSSGGGVKIDTDEIYKARQQGQ
ncbi:S49 family peptidase [Spartinivicinus poritis]|uniref:S49 family peptidase n=1 Tax=Spartinivicinus poritis TaxID=2994640 RepID=A0ABT5UIY4_9GAMM|nr:S49 family peptidase [Spartinivicinus sp. A2-2]MDE1465931.1 S49 family peptidase [Spartinivicinus sp. A2-2]